MSGSQVDELSRLRTVLHKAQENKEDPDVVTQKIRELSPKLADYITSKPKILRNAIIGIIFAGFTVFETDININVDLNINQTTNKIINQLNIDADKANKLQPKQEQSKKDVGRNEPCPCGSGKKYKKCCGMI